MINCRINKTLTRKTSFFFILIVIILYIFLHTYVLTFYFMLVLVQFSYIYHISLLSVSTLRPSSSLSSLSMHRGTNEYEEFKKTIIIITIRLKTFKGE